MAVLLGSLIDMAFNFNITFGTRSCGWFMLQLLKLFWIKKRASAVHRHPLWLGMKWCRSLAKP
jgi:hypothetical protein